MEGDWLPNVFLCFGKNEGCYFNNMYMFKKYYTYSCYLGVVSLLNFKIIINLGKFLYYMENSDGTQAWRFGR